jgi:hypothetical protein
MDDVVGTLPDPDYSQAEDSNARHGIGGEIKLELVKHLESWWCNGAVGTSR